jgi:hypothetical protein
MSEQFAAEIMSIPIPTEVQWLPSTYTITQRRQTGEITTSSEVCVVIETKVRQRFIKQHIKSAGVLF